MYGVRIIGEGDLSIHIAGCQPTIITLCGWCDVDSSPSQQTPDCPECLRIVAYCKSLKIRKTTLAQVEAKV
jgi:hypothetical protein